MDLVPGDPFIDHLIVTLNRHSIKWAIKWAIK